MTDLIEPEPAPPADVPAASAPVEPEDHHAGVARKNVRLGWSLFGLSLLLFAGTWVVAFIYLALE